MINLVSQQRKILPNKGISKSSTSRRKANASFNYVIVIGFALIIVAIFRPTVDLSKYEIEYSDNAPASPSSDPARTTYLKQDLIFHFVHTTNEASFNRRSVLAVESAFFHHPNASVLIHVPDDGSTIGIRSDMTEKPFSRLIEAGYNVTVNRFKLRKLVDTAISLPGSSVEQRYAQQWFQNQILKHMMKWNWYVDISDLVRLLVLYNQGGIYTDTDVIFVNPVGALPNSFGLVQPSRPGSGVLKFNKGNVFLAHCINEYFQHFRSNTHFWGYVGPKLLKRVWKSKYPTCEIPEPPAVAGRQSTDALLTMIPERSECPFYALWQDVYYPNVDDCFSVTSTTAKKQKHIAENTFIAHTYNQRTKWALEKMNITRLREDDTLCNWLYKSFCIFCDEDVWNESELKVTK